MRKLLVGAVLAVAMAAVGPPAMAQQLDRLTIERLAPPAPSAGAIEDQGVLVNTVYRVEHEALPLKTADKAAGKKRNGDAEGKAKGRTSRAAVPSYHLLL